jgi:tetratricopeptide (TPR) repeat protein
MYLRQAGAKALARSANTDAVSCFEQALAALRRLPETRERMGQAIDLRFDLRNSLYPLGELDTLHGHLRDAEVLAVSLGDPRRLGWVSVYMSQQLWVTGHPTEARTFAQSGLAHATAVGDFALTAAANYHLGLACHASGDFRQAESCFRTVIQLLPGDLCLERCGLEGFPALLSRGYLAWTLAERGQFNEGIVQGRDGRRIAQTVDSPFSLTMAHRGLGSLYCVQGDFDNAIPLLEAGLALARDSNMTLLSPTVMGWLGYAYALSGRGAESLSLLREAVAGIESMGIGAFHALRCVQLGEAYLLTGQPQDALALASQALSIARERRQRGYEAYALRFLGAVAARRAPPEHADGHYRDAFVLAEELGMRPLVAHCHLGLGKLYRRTGKREQASEHLTIATAMYREMGMTYWWEQAEAEMKEST